MRNVSDKFGESIKTHILYSITFFRRSCPLWDDVEIPLICDNSVITQN